MIGPPAPYAIGFREELARQGYTPHAASNQLQLMAHAGRWLASRGPSVDELIPARVEEFLAHRRTEGHTLWLSAKAVVPVLGYLRGLGVLPTPAPAVPATEAEQLQGTTGPTCCMSAAWRRAPSPATCTWPRLAFSARAIEGELHLERLSAAEVTEFVLAECAPRWVGSAKYVVCGLRSLLRYLCVAGYTDAQLDAAVPKVAGWRLAGVPTSFGQAEVAHLVAGCDRRSTFGRRDYAVPSLLA